MAGVDRSADIKERIRARGRELFTARGFASTGVRDIARAAGVDPTIVIRHFGSKENLFLETVSLPSEWHQILAGPLDDLPARLLRLMFSPAPSTPGRGVFTAMIRASESAEVRSKLSEGLAATIAHPLAGRLSGPDAGARATVFAAVVVGFLTHTWVLEDESLSVWSSEDWVAYGSPVLAAILRGTP